jgi:tetratricopeptide (TPR) repeat protein
MRIVKSTLLVLSIVAASNVGFAASGVDPDKDPQMEKLLWDARHLIDSKNPAAAIPKCDAIISAYKAYYGSRKEKIYCGRSGTETLGALLKAAVDKENAIALSSTWADAYYMKAYALQDAHRLSEAKATLQLALKLSPFNSHYLAELGDIYALEKNWPKAMKVFDEAEDNAKLGPEDTQAEELGRARRGQGYVLVELGKLDEAEKKYKQCLASNPKDTKAKAELEYVCDQKVKRKAQ